MASGEAEAIKNSSKEAYVVWLGGSQLAHKCSCAPAHDLGGGLPFGPPEPNDDLLQLKLYSETIAE